MKIHPYYSNNLYGQYSSSTVLGSGISNTGLQFYLKAPCSIIGVAHYSLITDAHTLTAHLWNPSGEEIATKEYDMSGPGFIEIYFNEAYPVVLSDLIYYTPWTVSITCDDETYYTRNTGTRVTTGPHCSDKLIHCTTSCWTYSTSMTACPSTVAGSSQYPIDPIIVDSSPTNYESMPLHILYGWSGDLLGYLAWVGIANSTVGNQYIFKEPCTVYGMKFYTPYNASQVNKASLFSAWNTTSLGTGSLTTVRPGEYTVNFSSPVAITESLISSQSENSSFFYSGLHCSYKVYMMLNSSVYQISSVPFSLGNYADISHVSTYYESGDTCPISEYTTVQVPSDLIIGPAI